MKLNRDLLMTQAEGLKWHEYKATLGPLYPGYENFDVYMDWLRARFRDMGCVDFLEHRWPFNSYRVQDWPDHNSGALGLVSDGKKLPVGTFMMCSGSTGPEGLTAPLVYHDGAAGDPEPGAFAGKIAVIKSMPFPEPPYDEEFLKSYVITDTDYRSEPAPPAGLLETVDPAVSNSWNTRWEFFQWATLLKQAQVGGAAGMIVASSLTYGCLEGLYDRCKRHPEPCLVVDRVTSETLIADAKAGKTATMTLISEFFDCENQNFICFLPGADYGTDKDEYVSLNAHVDAMSLTQDNGSLGLLGVCRYFAALPQAARRKTLLFCIDTRHFIEGGDFSPENWPHDPYQVFPELVPKVTATIGLEHMGEMEAREDYAHNTMVPTGLPELTFMRSDDNYFCARILIEAAVESGLERADIKIDSRPGLHGMFKGRVRAIMAMCHKLGVCEIGQAGNWPGAHTQTFSTLQYFGPKKFRDEVEVWTRVTGELMEADSILYDLVWAKLNVAVRTLCREGTITDAAREGLLGNLRSIFRHVERGEYATAARRLEREFQPAIRTLLGPDAPVLELADSAMAKLNR